MKKYNKVFYLLIIMLFIGVGIYYNSDQYLLNPQIEKDNDNHLIITNDLGKKYVIKDSYYVMVEWRNWTQAAPAIEKGLYILTEEVDAFGHVNTFIDRIGHNNRHKECRNLVNEIASLWLPTALSNEYSQYMYSDDKIDYISYIKTDSVLRGEVMLRYWWVVFEEDNANIQEKFFQLRSCFLREVTTDNILGVKEGDILNPASSNSPYIEIITPILDADTVYGVAAVQKEIATVSINEGDTIDLPFDVGEFTFQKEDGNLKGTEIQWSQTYLIRRYGSQTYELVVFIYDKMND